MSDYGAAPLIDESERSKLLHDYLPGSRLSTKTKRSVGSTWIFAFMLVAVVFVCIEKFDPSLLGLDGGDDDGVDDEISIEPDTFNPSSVTSPDDVLDGGWSLVRCVSSSEGTWHPATDNLRGSDQYGTYADYRNDTTFTLTWKTSDVKMYLFALTDFSYWLVTKKAQIFEFGAPTSSTVLVSSASADSYEAGWYIREHNLEDPWVSVYDHGEGGVPFSFTLSFIDVGVGMSCLEIDFTGFLIPPPTSFDPPPHPDADEPGMVYGENSKKGHLEHLGSEGRGACVWIR
jgi:hypothetical protein